MTTTVRVDAHCSKKVRVLVEIENDGNDEQHYLEDGESGEYYAYDDRSITVTEVVKTGD